MKRMSFILILLYSFFFLAGSVFGIGEKTHSFGAASLWKDMETRRGIAEASSVRPHPVLVLSGGGDFSAEKFSAGVAGGTEDGSGFREANVNDLYLSFDEGRPEQFRDSRGNYEVSVSPALAAAAVSRSRFGAGAAQFAGNADSGGALVLKPGRNALFAPGSHIRDFSVEFWLYPLNMENGEQILLWNSSKNDGRGGYINQSIRCVSSRNRLEWNFDAFFFSPGERDSKALSLSGPAILPRTWSHHLVRFDADLGLLEYLVDGRLEDLDYTTFSGREGGDVYTPLIGEDCRLVLGKRFSGLVDEFRIYGGCLEKFTLAKYASGGRAESRTLDLGSVNSRVLKIEASGGRTFNAGGRLRSEYTGSGVFRFGDHAEMVFYIRTGNNPYNWNDVPWFPVTPGAQLPDTFRGRYVQAAVDFYPGEDGETSPYLSELKLLYEAAEAPPPPAWVSASAKDGAVELSWKASVSRSTAGYLVYYGTARGEYFGDHAILGSVAAVSPIDVGNRTSVRIEGLRNGTLYYFAVASYDAAGSGEGYLVPEPGEFSREAAARPLSALPVRMTE